MSLFSNEVPRLGKGTTINGSLIPDRIIINVPLLAASASQTAFIAPVGTAKWQVTTVNSSFGTASSSGTFSVEVATGTTAVGSGTAQVTSPVALSGTANTSVSTAVTTQTAIAAGSRVNVIIAGTMTSLVAGFVQIELQRIA